MLRLSCLNTILGRQLARDSSSKIPNEEDKRQEKLRCDHWRCLTWEPRAGTASHDLMDGWT